MEFYNTNMKGLHDNFQPRPGVDAKWVIFTTVPGRRDLGEHRVTHLPIAVVQVSVQNFSIIVIRRVRAVNSTSVHVTSIIVDVHDVCPILNFG